MVKAVIKVIEPKMKSYMAHRVRSAAQFSKPNLETSKFTSTLCVLWLDHKQKTLPQRCREGQVVCFAKRGMSLLGFMFCRRETRSKKFIHDTILTHCFYIVVIQDY